MCRTPGQIARLTPSVVLQTQTDQTEEIALELMSRHMEAPAVSLRLSDQVILDDLAMGDPSSGGSPIRGVSGRDISVGHSGAREPAGLVKIVKQPALARPDSSSALLDTWFGTRTSGPVNRLAT